MNVDPKSLNNNTLGAMLNKSRENLNEANTLKKELHLSNNQLFEMQGMNAEAKPLFMEAMSRSRSTRSSRSAKSASSASSGASSSPASSAASISRMAALFAASSAGSSPAAATPTSATGMNNSMLNSIASSLSGSTNLDLDIAMQASMYGVDPLKLSTDITPRISALKSKSIGSTASSLVGSVASLVSTPSPPVAAAAAPAPGVYFENQVGVFCAKHALNHVLQEEKFKWDSNPALKFIGGVDPMIPAVQINVHKACEDYEAGYRNTLAEHELETQFLIAMSHLNATRKRPTAGNTSVRSNTGMVERNYKTPADVLQAQHIYDTNLTRFKLMADWDNARKTQEAKIADLRSALLAEIVAEVYVDEDDRCQLARYGETPGQLPIQVIPPLLRNLNMTFRLLYSDGESTAHYNIGEQPPLAVTGRDIRNLHSVMDTELPRRDCLGAVINIPGHYIAIVKHENCSDGKYLLIDSMDPSSTNDCLTLANLKRQLPPYNGHTGRGKVKGIIFLYTNAGSYVSHASSMLAARAAAPAGAAAASGAGTGAGAPRRGGKRNTHRRVRAHKRRSTRRSSRRRLSRRH
jgi:hypothetical protein